MAEFIDENGGAGVRPRKRHQKKVTAAMIAKIEKFERLGQIPRPR
jgi:hypothetical protein